MRNISAYIEMTKPRILTLILVTTALGFYVGGHGVKSWTLLFFTLFGAGLVCGGAAVLNNYLERDVDARMLRTKNRPIPSGIISPSAALSFGISLILSGIVILYWKVNLLTSFLSLLTSFLYIVVYTPMKRLSWLNTTFGAIPGAIPPMGGWAAATGDLSFGAWILFAILFVWQHPHFYAIAWMLKEDYKRAGFKMLPVVDETGRKTFFHILLFSLFLIPVSMAPTMIGMSGSIYMVSAFLLSVMLLAVGMLLFIRKTIHSAKLLLRATVLYLPLLLIFIIIDFNL